MPVAIRQRRLLKGAALGVAALTVAAQAQASFKIEHNPVTPKEPRNSHTYSQVASPAFDPSNYVVWVDNQYSAVMEYGEPGRRFDPAPSYGDPMSLSDALGLLVPTQWRVLRDKSLSGDLIASWSVASGSWVDVLRNLGERHGLQFHVDHNRSTVFVKEGRKLLNESESEVEVRYRTPAKEHAPSVASKGPDVTEQTARRMVPSFLTYDISKGQSGEAILSEVGMMLGYETAYWMTTNRTVDTDQRFQGAPMTVLNDIAAHLNVKTCLYDADSVLATIRRSGECPK